MPVCSMNLIADVVAVAGVIAAILMEISWSHVRAVSCQLSGAHTSPAHGHCSHTGDWRQLVIELCMYVMCVAVIGMKLKLTIHLPFSTIIPGY